MPAFARLLPLAVLALPLTASAQKPFSFTCDASTPTPDARPRVAGDPVARGTTRLTAGTVYSATRDESASPAFGFDIGTAPTSFAGGSCSGGKPFFFSLAVPEGNYQVAVDLGGPQASVNTVRAEARRLMVDALSVPAGKTQTVTFNVNVRFPPVAGAPPQPDGKPLSVRLKPREFGNLDWDERLTLEFNGSNPSVRSITVKPLTHTPTVYLAGDSTMVDQDNEPWAAWGQMLPFFFNDKIVIANNAESGETIKSFEGERRFAKIFSTLTTGDFLFIQFAHNDQKAGAGFVPIPEYKDLMRKYIAQSQAKGATPILVTSMNRRTFDAGGHITQTLGDYPQATRDVGAETHVAVIDLNAMSKTLYEALGDAGTLKAFVHYPANTFPNQAQELKDDTHFNSYGALELAKCVVQGIRDGKLPLAQFLKPNLSTFNPAHPDPVADFHQPPSPLVNTATPYGR